jgi:hypothetical protein
MRTLPDFTRQREEMHEASAYVEYVRMLARRGSLHDLPDDTPAFRKIKAAVGSTDPTAFRHASTEFVRLLELQTILGQMRGSWWPAPPFTPVVDLDASPTGTFIGEGGAIPATKLPVVTLTTEVGKLGTIFPFDTRTLTSLDPKARRLFESAFVAWLRVLEDREFLSTTAAVPGTRPAGILHDATLVPSSGSTPEDVRTDVAALFAAVSGGMPRAPYYICSPGTAQVLLAMDPPGMVSGDGLAVGVVPVITSLAAGTHIILIDAGRLVVVDELLEVAGSTQAAVEMDDAPTGSSAVPTGAVMVSGWQTTTSFIRAIRYLWWALTTDDAVAYTDVAGAGS